MAGVSRAVPRQFLLKCLFPRQFLLNVLMVARIFFAFVIGAGGLCP
jgi:hypothetical protein